MQWFKTTRPAREQSVLSLLHFILTVFNLSMLKCNWLILIQQETSCLSPHSLHIFVITTGSDVTLYSHTKLLFVIINTLDQLAVPLYQTGALLERKLPNGK